MLEILIKYVIIYILSDTEKVELKKLRELKAQRKAEEKMNKGQYNAW